MQKSPPRYPEVVDASAGHLLTLIRDGRATTRSDLRRLTGLSRTAVVTRLTQLADAGLVLLGEELASTGGRPPGSLVFAADAAVVLAVAVGRSRTQLGVFDLAGTELAAAEVDHEVGAEPDEVLPDVVAALAQLLHGLGSPIVGGVGVGLPGTVSPELGVSVDSPVMRGWDGLDVGPVFAGFGPDGDGERPGVPVWVDNDADVLARAERLGPLADVREMVVVKASTGLGLGIVSAGRVVHGHLGGAGEIGHVPVAGAEGLPCRCGRTGCLETVAGGWALAARLAERGREVTHVRDVVRLARDGDPEARRLLREGGHALGETLAVAVDLLNPQYVVLGGDMAEAFDAYATGVREALYARASALATRELQVVPSTHGERSGLVGCAALALARLLDPARVDRELALRSRG